MKRVLAAVLLAGAVPGLAAPPAPPPDVETLVRQAADLPNHGSLKLDLAMALARAGRAEEGLGWLRRAAAMGIGADLRALEDAFGAATANPAFQQVRRRFEENVSPLARGEVAFRLGERDLFPESVAYDPVRRAFYVGGMYRRKIVKVDAAGAVSDFVPSGRDGLWSVLGIKVDAQRRELWANACNLGRGPAMADPEPATEGRTAVFRYDLEPGRLVRRYDGPQEPRPLCFNDLDLTASGDVYVSAGGDGIFRVDRARDALELFTPATGLFVNGLALSADGRNLYLAAHARGVMVLDLVTRGLQPLGMPEGATLNGIDGLYVHRGSLVGVQNALRHGPMRVVQAFLDPAGHRATCVATLDRNHPLHDIPTTGVVVGDTLHYVATSQLASFEADGRPLPWARLKENVILKVPLLDRCPADASAAAELLAVHARDRQAHLATDVDLLLSDAGDEFISVSGGRVSRITPAEQRAFFTGYFKDAAYQEWDDLEPPIVRVSADGTLGWVITRLRVRRTQKDASGTAKETRFVYAGIMTYEKRAGVWVRVANVSTFERP